MPHFTFASDDKIQCNFGGGMKYPRHRDFREMFMEWIRKFRIWKISYSGNLIHRPYPEYKDSIRTTNNAHLIYIYQVVTMAFSLIYAGLDVYF